MKFRRLGLTSVIVCLALTVGFAAFFLQRSKPLGQGPLIQYPTGSASQATAQLFLDGTFSLITDARNLPGPVLRAFTEQGGSRLVIANPGKRFTATDAVEDATLPSKRLIFAGVAGEKCFVHYEQGGFSHSFLVALFEVDSSYSMKPIWQGYRGGPAKGIDELRAWLRDGSRSSHR